MTCFFRGWGVRSGLLASVFLALATVVALLTPPATAQSCGPQWLPGQAGQPMNGTAKCMLLFDPDGAGPLGTWLFIGGNRLHQDGVPESCLVAFDGQAWRRFGDEATALNDYVTALVVYNNQLIAAGRFVSIGGVSASNIARWDGAVWSPLGAGTNNQVTALEVYNGSLYAGGFFTTVGGGIASPGVARWDGSAWSGVTTSISIGGVNALKSFRSLLYVGGGFTSINGVNATNLAAWNGSTWTTAGQPNGTVFDLERFTGSSLVQDRLFVAGGFTTVNGQATDRVAIWNPNTATWTGAGAPPAGLATDVFVRLTGVSSYQLSGIFGGRIATLSTGTWTTLGDTTDGACTRIGLYAGQYVAGRQGVVPGYDSVVKVWSGTQWNMMGPGVPGQLWSVIDAGNGAITGSSFRGNLSGVGGENTVVQRAAGGTGWIQLGGSAVSSALTGNLIWCLAHGSGADVFAGGSFDHFGAVSAPFIARWDGAAWSSVGTDFSGTVTSLQVMPNGDLVAAGVFSQNLGGSGMAHIARWNGSAWAGLGGGIGNGTVYALALLPNGDLVAAGSFTLAGSPAVPVVNAARWNGAAWSALGTQLDIAGNDDYVADVAAFPDGRLAAVLNKYPANPPYDSRLYVWNGTSWNIVATLLGQAGLGVAPIHAITTMPDNSLVAAGYFASIEGVAASSVARWDGAWHRMGASGLQGGVALHTSVADSGDLLLGGGFVSADGDVSAFFAAWGVPAGCGGCDGIDFNGDTLFPDTQDIADFLAVFAGAPCPTGACGDVDFNNDNLFPDTEDIAALLRVFAGGQC